MKKEYLPIKEFMLIERPADRFKGQSGSAMLTCKPSSYFDSAEGVRRHNAMCITAVKLGHDKGNMDDTKCSIISDLSYVADKPAGETWVQILIRAGIPKAKILLELEKLIQFVSEEWAEG